MTQATASDFLAAIIANPDDDAPRLIYADWLYEQNGCVDPPRGEFIRVQCEQAKLPEPEYKTIDAFVPTLADYEWGRCARCSPDARCRWHALDRRVRELLKSHGSDWWIEEVANPLELYQDLDTTNFASAGKTEIKRVYRNHPHVWRRGFIAELTCSASDWRGGLNGILQRQPVEKLTLSLNVGGELSWFAMQCQLVRASSLREIVLVPDNPLFRRTEIDACQHWLAKHLPGIKVRLRDEPPPESTPASLFAPENASYASTLAGLQIITTAYLSRHPGWMFDPTNPNRLLVHPEVREIIQQMLAQANHPPSVGST